MNDKVRKSAVLQEAITSIKVSQILPCYFVSLYSQSIVQLLTRERDELRLDRDRMKQEVSKLASCLQFSHMGSMVAANAMAMTQMPNPGGVPPTGPTVLGLFSTRAFAKMSAPIDDLLYDDDDDDDICTTHRDSHIELTTIIAMEDTGMAAGGLAQQPVAMGMLAPPSAVLAPQQMLVQPPVGVIAPPHSAMATPIAYTPSPTGSPPATTPEEKIKNLFQLIHKRFPEKYKPLHDEVRNRPMVVKATMPRTFPTQPTMKAEPVATIPFSQSTAVSYQAAPAPSRPMAPPQRAPTPVVAAPANTPEANGKIRFARQLLAHSATCTSNSGECKAFAKCEDIKRFFKHTVTCTAGRECNHCEQLRTLVKLHATDCAVGPRDRCPIPFCDNMRLNVIAVATPQRQVPVKEQQPTSPPRAMHDDHGESMKKQPAAAQPPVPSQQPVSVSHSTTPQPQQQQQQPHMATNYGHILQMILHCQQCTLSSGCGVPGCADSKDVMRETQNPGTTMIKAKTFLQVMGHFKQCANKAICPVCSVGMQPVPFAVAPQPSTTAPASTPAASPSPSGKYTATSPRSPREGGPAKKAKASPATAAPTSAAKKATVMSYQQQTHPGAIETYDLTEELAPTNANDLRLEADVLTHTSIDPQAEKRIMLAGVPPRAKQLAPKKETWSELFQHHGLQQTMAKALVAGGLQAQLGDDVIEVMGLALHEYLKQVLEEMVEVAKQRNDVYANSIPRKQPPPPSNQPTKTAVEILRLSSDEHFNRQMQTDQALRSELLEEGRKDESADKDKNKRRKGKANPKAAPSSSSASKKDLIDKDEEDMDIDELARKDLKLKLLQEGSVMLEGRVNTSIAPNARRNKHEVQVTMEDAEYWLRSQKPYVDAKLFCRAAAARIHAKNL
ncbi:hypothetical protein DYB25_004358 [Aphanomyces astaci]|uniref:TAZ-type domain-containing protein n=1 Tax=Aphanomyces astaci TaxID=112090 RepID=A0A397B018_APHAT|nr:hypothetical protein DYB25_004358 [Aphanomyces astaci]